MQVFRSHAKIQSNVQYVGMMSHSFIYIVNSSYIVFFVSVQCICGGFFSGRSRVHHLTSLGHRTFIDANPDVSAQMAATGV